MKRIVKSAACAVVLSLLMSPAWASPYSVELNLNGSSVTGEVNPIKAPPFDETQFYNNGDPLLPVQLPQQTLAFYLFENTSNQLSLAMVLAGGVTDSSISVTSTGLTGQGVTTLLRDDPDDGYIDWDDTTGTMQAFFDPGVFNDTDGMILGYLPSAADSSWYLTVDFTLQSGYSDVFIFDLRDPFVSPETSVVELLAGSIVANTTSTVTFSRTGETVVAMSEPAGILFPLGALFLIGGIARNRRRS